MTTEQIEIYVRSSPLGSDGIHWRNVNFSKSEQPRGTPDILMKQVVPDDDGHEISINSAIDTVKPCLVLAKYNGKVLLEVTGIDSMPDRSEKLGRRISEVVLWVGDANEEIEKRLRKLAHCALIGLWEKDSKFRTAISSSIEFDGLNDYKVDADVLKKIYDTPEEYTTEKKNLNLGVVNSSNYNYLDPQEINSDDAAKADVKVRQLAVQIRDSLFGNRDTAVVISEVKQSEGKRWLNHRGNIVELSQVAPVIPPTYQADHPVISSAGDVPVKKTKSKVRSLKLRSHHIIAAIMLILLLLILLILIGQRYPASNGEIEQITPALEVIPSLSQ